MSGRLLVEMFDEAASSFFDGADIMYCESVFISLDA